MRDQILEEIEKMDEQRLRLVYRLVLALEPTGRLQDGEDWAGFVEATYGCLAEAPIERSPQGDFEIRDPLL